MDTFNFLLDEEFWVWLTVILWPFFFLEDEVTIEIFWLILIGPYLTPPNTLEEAKLPVDFLFEKRLA